MKILVSSLLFILAISLGGCQASYNDAPSVESEINKVHSIGELDD